MFRPTQSTAAPMHAHGAISSDNKAQPVEAVQGTSKVSQGFLKGMALVWGGAAVLGLSACDLARETAPVVEPSFEQVNVNPGSSVAGPSSVKWNNGYQFFTNDNIAGNRPEFVGARREQGKDTNQAIVRDFVTVKDTSGGFKVFASDATTIMSKVEQQPQTGTLANALTDYVRETYSTNNGTEVFEIIRPRKVVNYSALSIWNDKSTAADNFSSYGAVGQQTGTADMPTTGVGSFKGKALGDIGRANHAGYTFTGDANATVNFGTGQMQGRVDNIKAYDKATENLNTSLLQSVTLNGTVSGTKVNGTAVASGLIAPELVGNKATHQAFFFGPGNDLELGGGFLINNENTHVQGGYVADQR